MSTDKEVDVLGIDISKAKFDVALLRCMEAKSIYGNGLARFLVAAG